ncbi:MAG: LptA/OstA family protein [Armatimonadota bacterium]
MIGISPARFAAVLTALLLMAPGRPAAFAGPPPAKTSAITITADAMDIDAQKSVVTATGRVRLSDGRITAAAGRGTLYQNEQRAVLTDGPRMTGPQGTLQAAEIVITYTARNITRVTARGQATLESRIGRLSAPTIAIALADETAIAEGGVSVTAPPDARATGRRLTYAWRRGIAVLEGDARVQNRDGFVSGDRIHAEDRSRRATVTGAVLARFRDIEVRSLAAEVFGAEKKAVFTGDVQVNQPGRQMTTEKATVWYEARRVVAEGQTRVRLEGQP